MLSGYEIAHGLIGGIFVGLVYALLSAGFSLTWGVTRVINLAHAAFALIGSYITLTLLELAGVDPLISILFIVPVLFILGLGMHYFMIKPTAKRTKDITSASMVLSFGLYMIVENLLVVIFKSDDRVLHSRYSDLSFHIGPISVAMTSVTSLAIAVVSLGVIYFFLNRTYTGKAVRGCVAGHGRCHVIWYQRGERHCYYLRFITGFCRRSWTLSGADVFCNALYRFFVADIYLSHCYHGWSG